MVLSNTKRIKTTDLSNFDKQWSDVHFVSFLFYYYCMPPIKSPEMATTINVWISSVILQVTSVTSYGSGGSDEALLPEVKVATSPRRTNRENLPLLSRVHRSTDYEDIDDNESLNTFPGKIWFFLIYILDTSCFDNDAIKQNVFFFFKISDL